MIPSRSLKGWIISSSIIVYLVISFQFHFHGIVVLSHASPTNTATPISPRNSSVLWRQLCKVMSLLFSSNYFDSGTAKCLYYLKQVSLLFSSNRMNGQVCEYLCSVHRMNGQVYPKCCSASVFTVQGGKNQRYLLFSSNRRNW